MSSPAHLDLAWTPVLEAPAATALFVDFDGTLAPIVDDPARATPRRDAVSALVELADHLALVAIVSGRPVAFVRTHVPDRRVVVVGQYGLERDEGDGVVADSRAAAYAVAIDAAARDVERTWPDLRVERKGEMAVTLHWRARAGPPPAPDAITAIADTHGLVAWPARMACELRPPVAVDKGTAVADLLDARPPTVAVFAGDDEGDRRAFAALDDWCAASPARRAVRIALESDESPPLLLAAADLVLAGPPALAAQLVALAAAI